MSRDKIQHLQVRDGRHINFFMTDNAIVDIYGSRLSHPTFKLYIGMCRWTKGGTSVVRIGYDHIQKTLDLSSATVAKGLRSLVEEGLLTVEHTYNETGKEANIYVLQPIPLVSSPDKETSDGSFISQRNHASGDEGTLLHDVNHIKTEGDKEREEEIDSASLPTVMTTEQHSPWHPAAAELAALGLHNLDAYVQFMHQIPHPNAEVTLTRVRRERKRQRLPSL